MRYLSLDRVKKDLTLLKKRFRAKIINFQDDNLLIDKERAHKIIDFANNKLKLQLYFQNGLAMRSLDKKMLQAMKKTGVTSLVLPIESGSSRVLKEIMHKPSDLSVAQQVVDNCRRLGLDTDVNILIGLPGETKKDIEETRKFLISLDANWFRIVVATPLVGSEMYDICREKKYIKEDDIECDYKNAIVNTEHFTAEYIVKKAYLLNLEINFVKNSDFRLGNYKKALERFENTINVKEDHAFAYYFAAKCCKKMGQNKKCQAYKKKYRELVKNSILWRNYAKKFRLSPLR